MDAADGCLMQDLGHALVCSHGDDGDPVPAPLSASDPGWGGRAGVDAAVGQHEGAGGLLLFLSSPYHLSEAEAQAWASAELARLLDREDVEWARLTRLRSASPRWPRPWDWMLELEMRSQLASGARVLAGWHEWLGDLRLLGMRPAAVVAADGRLIAADGRSAEAVAIDGDERCTAPLLRPERV